MMQHQLTILGLVALTVSVASSSSGGSVGYMLHVCNRGYCYYKKEDGGGRKKNTLLPSSVVDVDLLEILSPHIFEEEEAVQCRGSKCKKLQQQQQQQHSSRDIVCFDYDILDDEDLDYNNKRRSWKEEPKRGKCIDHDQGSVYTCNLVEILDEGSLLIEDLRQDGLLHPQPKCDFSNNKKNMKRNNNRRKKQTHPPSVVVTGDDPTEDFRTVVELNMMGI